MNKDSETFIYNGIRVVSYPIGIHTVPTCMIPSTSSSHHEISTEHVLLRMINLGADGYWNQYFTSVSLGHWVDIGGHWSD